MTVGSIASVEESRQEDLFCIRIEHSHRSLTRITHAWIWGNQIRHLLLCTGISGIGDLIGRSILFNKRSRRIRFPTDNGWFEIKCEDMS